MDSFLKINAPKKGYILAFYQDRLVFESYTIKDGELIFEGCKALRDEMPWECHLFDEERECRRIYRESAGDWIEQFFTRAQALGRHDREEANAYSADHGDPLPCRRNSRRPAGQAHHVDMQSPADTVGLSVSFFRIIMFFLVFNAVSIVLNAALRGIGKTPLTLISSIVMGVVDIFAKLPAD